MSNVLARVLRLCPCLVLASFGVSTGAFAQSGEDANLSWVLPTQGMTQSGQIVNLAPGDLAQINIYMNGVLTTTAPGDATTAVVLDIPFGPNDFFVTAVHTNGSESTMSNTITRTPSDPVTPNAPNLLDVVVAVVRICDSGVIPGDLTPVCNYLASR